MDNKTLKIAVVGLGRMGLLHTAIINSLPMSKVVAVVDPAWFPAKPLQMFNPNISVYKSIKKMLAKQDIDGIVIASPVGHHVENALECVENNIPFLMEKLLVPVRKTLSRLLQHVVTD